MVLDRQGSGLLRRHQLGDLSPRARHAQTGDAGARQRRQEGNQNPGRHGTRAQLHLGRRFPGRRHLGRDGGRIEPRNSPTRCKSEGTGSTERQGGSEEVITKRSHSMKVAELLSEITTGPVTKRAITNHRVLNEAYDYGSAFSRGMRIDLNGLTILLISGTASIDEINRIVRPFRSMRMPREKALP